MRTTVGLRLLYGFMDYTKQPTDIDGQIDLLLNRELMIKDIAAAKLHR